MKYRLSTPWPVAGGAKLVAASTVIDTDRDVWAKGLAPPIDAQPLDEETWRFMRVTNLGQEHRLGPPLGGRK